MGSDDDQIDSDVFGQDEHLETLDDFNDNLEDYPWESSSAQLEDIIASLAPLTY